jgi:shikimate kinase
MHIKLKGSPAIYLVGFMGSGKSTAGRLLAAQLGWEFIDLDDEIERDGGAKIADIFAKSGEPAFRVIEHRVLLEQIVEVRRGNPRVISLGGGAFVQAKNLQRIQDGGISIFLDCPAEELWKRVTEQGDDRPLARDHDEFVALYETRRPAYERADFTIAAHELTPEEIVARVRSLSLV